jgi:hypothetical protein
MKLSQLKPALDIFFSLPRQRVPLIQSSPGVGKSSTVEQIANERAMRLITWRLGQMDASEVGGMPEVNNHRMSYALPDTLPGENDAPTIVFLDEIADAERMVYNAAAEFILDGTLRGAHTFKLAPQHRIVAASNRLSDRAGARDLPSHIRNRVVFMDVETDMEEWVANFAIPFGVREEVIAFIKHRPHLLDQFNPKERSFPTPRSWEAVSDMLPGLLKLPQEHLGLQFEMVSGAVGEGAATEFTGFLRLISRMPDIDEVLKNPEKAPVPTDEVAIMYALCTALSMRVTNATRENFFTYMGRIPQDFAVMAVKDAQRKNVSIMQCRNGIKWATVNAPMMV